MDVKRILVIDDEKNVAYSIKRALASGQIRVETAASGLDGVNRYMQCAFDAVIVDIRLPDITGLDVMRRIAAINRMVPIVVMTAYSAADTAIEAIKDGAFDYLVKPVDLSILNEVVERALRCPPTPFTSGVMDQSHEINENSFIGQSAPMQEVYKLIGRYSREQFPVLILGESGTGKELAALSIHKHSSRNSNPFVAINCAAIPESLLESELFGHEKGAFSGADRIRIGKFEQAKNGTIFLDEVGDMPPKIQAKMLRIIQEQQFERVGGSNPIVTNARIIAATNRDLNQLVLDGQFRNDLLYRLNCLTLKLPPLRDRTGDIHDLAMSFLALYNKGNIGRNRVFHPSVLALLEKYAWPGNVRELRNVVNFSAINSRTPVILPESLPVTIGTRSAVAETFSGLNESILGFVANLIRDGNNEVYRRAISTIEKLVIREVLKHFNENQVQASEMLGISRTTLRAKCLLHDLESK